MREIKFRAWNKDFKEIWTAQDLIDNDYQLYANGRICTPLLFEVDDCSQQFILMQYIGREDKNGAEIYEGDVVVNNSGSYFDDSRVIDIVRGCYGVKDFVIYELWHADLEVIGNIYENPELLEVT